MKDAKTLKLSYSDCMLKILTLLKKSEMQNNLHKTRETKRPKGRKRAKYSIAIKFQNKITGNNRRKKTQIRIIYSKKDVNTTDEKA